jgi:ribosomal protein L24E
MMDKFCVRMSEMILKSENYFLLVSKKKKFLKVTRNPRMFAWGVNIQDGGIIGQS